MKKHKRELKLNRILEANETEFKVDEDGINIEPTPKQNSERRRARIPVQQRRRQASRSNQFVVTALPTLSDLNKGTWISSLSLLRMFVAHPRFAMFVLKIEA
jgi:hypothetical protein